MQVKCLEAYLVWEVLTEHQPSRVVSPLPQGLFVARSAKPKHSEDNTPSPHWAWPPLQAGDGGQTYSLLIS